MKKKLTNISASVHARLLARAKAENRPFIELLQYYAMERFLYRLSQVDHANKFVLKGGLMLQFWGGPIARATKDIDLHRTSTATISELVEMVRACLRLDVEDDGIHFDLQSVVGEEIRLAAHYDGVRVRFTGHLGNARVALQLDVGFGDVITPSVRLFIDGRRPCRSPGLLHYHPLFRWPPRNKRNGVPMCAKPRSGVPYQPSTKRLRCLTTF